MGSPTSSPPRRRPDCASAGGGVGDASAPRPGVTLAAPQQNPVNESRRAGGWRPAIVRAKALARTGQVAI